MMDKNGDEGKDAEKKKEKKGDRIIRSEPTEKDRGYTL